ncbi:unnamed protein product [Eruca vesicaria subsp. sativa]|uniref:Uncharacterized protein n=1 Tax=Eruca vesicaria subsp. sativa TaxID=29727 RepID=A0ABC8J2F0_ERUVS|nr:unnamed protein product [Eruca vesicaria subsp. sativa]
MGRPLCYDKSNVKKGLWTAEEDAKILAYVPIHGVGKWSLIPKEAGLNQCGKSCRLRWTNYLRPDLKHDSTCRDIRCSMGGNGIIALVRAVVSLGIIVFLLVGILADAATSLPSTDKVKTLRFSGKDVNLFHVSKRKVPNGADPIHNRKAETSRRPPRV